MLSLILSTSTSLFHVLLVLKNWSSYCLEIHKTNIQDSQGATHSLSRYYAMWNEPRPGSSTTDKETAVKFSNFCEKQQLYREQASATGSVWDFSSRWMRNASDLTSLAVTSVVPVDLNAFILKIELDISLLATVIGKSSAAKCFTRACKHLIS